ncbi:uncharacterized protein [Clytia hemisphaerica]|uniref:uncharacterized protein n=1 Tax=Clytia hemisphaerica TaxID=252671 RepID=UPI0034D77F0E
MASNFDNKQKTLAICSCAVVVLYFLYAWEGHNYIFKRSIIPTKTHDNKITNRNEQNSSLEWLDRNSSTTHRNYGDGTCKNLVARKIFLRLLRKWKEIAEEHKVRYFLDAGTLLGAWRDEEFVPYDGDVDLAVHVDDLVTLRKLPILVQSRALKSTRHDEGFYLYFTPDWNLPYFKRKRYNCKGKNVTRYMDECSFTDPMARLIHRDRHIDLYPFQDHDAGTFKYLPAREQKIYQKKDFFPLVKCQLADVVFTCPRNPLSLLKQLYGTNLSPQYVCHQGGWGGGGRGGKHKKKSNSKLLKIVLFIDLGIILLLAVIIYFIRRMRKERVAV